MSLSKAKMPCFCWQCKQAAQVWH